MKVVVFGGSGFLGSHVADALTEAGHDVIIFDKNPSPYLQESQTMVVGDILDAQSVDAVVQECDVVYNFAGIADIGECAYRPVDTVKYNILGNSLVLEAARKADVKRFVFASSVYVYSNYGSFYRSSKNACESFIQDYYSLYGLPYTILRYGSLYGGRADERNGIHRMIKKAIVEGKIVHFGDGEEIREYIHVKDAATLSIEILKPEYENQHVVLTGTQTLKFKDLLKMINEMLGNTVEIEYQNMTSPSHYKITPYSFNPKLGKKLVKNSFIDIGQGILNCMAEIYSEVHQEKEEDLGIIVDRNSEKIDSTSQKD